MFKKGFILLLIMFYLLTLTSCGLDYRYSLDENLHEQIEYVSEDDATSNIIYQEKKYIFVGTTNFFKVETYKVDVNYYKSYDDIMLSWNGYRYIWYIDEYYSYTSDNPVFIYNKRLHWVYFRDDYNYLTDTFVIENTDEEFIFEDIFDSKQDSFDFENPVRVDVYSKQFSRIRTYVELVYVDEQWYLFLPDSDDVWIPSNDFLEILKQNDLIEVDK